MMTYTESVCPGCGFIRRDCMCSNPEWNSRVAEQMEAGIEGNYLHVGNC